MEERCSRCLHAVRLGDRGRRPPWCPHCGVDFVPAAPGATGAEPAAAAADPVPVPVGEFRTPAVRTGPSLFQVAVGVAFGLAVLGVVKDVLTRDPDKPFREQHLNQLRTLREQPPASVTFRRSEGLVVSDPAEVRTFLELVLSAEQVKPHGTEPVGEVTVTFPGAIDAYLVGRDSQNGDEFWLRVRTPGVDEPRRVVQFTSPPLTQWLQRTRVAALP